MPMPKAVTEVELAVRELVGLHIIAINHDGDARPHVSQEEKAGGLGLGMRK